jgi:predicted RNase H-like HicB family nuclease
MKIKVIIHEEADGGYWAEVPSLPGCVTQGDSMEELVENLKDAIEGVLAARADDVPMTNGGSVLEIAV